MNLGLYFQVLQIFVLSKQIKLKWNFQLMSDLWPIEYKTVGQIQFTMECGQPKLFF